MSAEPVEVDMDEIIAYDTKWYKKYVKDHPLTKRIYALQDWLKDQNYKYHVLDSPEISDFEYDSAYKLLVSFETAFPFLIRSSSPTQFVGYKHG